MAKKIDISKIKVGDRVDVGEGRDFFGERKAEYVLIVEVDDLKGVLPFLCKNNKGETGWFAVDQITAHYPAKKPKLTLRRAGKA